MYAHMGGYEMGNLLRRFFQFIFCILKNLITVDDICSRIKRRKRNLLYSSDKPRKENVFFTIS